MSAFFWTHSFAKTPKGDRSRGVTMLQASPHVTHFKSILDFGEGHSGAERNRTLFSFAEDARAGGAKRFYRVAAQIPEGHARARPERNRSIPGGLFRAGESALARRV